MPSTARHWTVYAALIAVQVFFGLHYLAAKVLLEEIPPRAWALFRVAAGAALLLLATRLSGRQLPTEPGVWGRLALYSIFGVVINQLCYVEGLSRTTPAHASILMTSIPVATLLFAALLGRERISGRKLLSLAIATLGVLLVIRPSAEDVAQVRILGDALTLVNAISYAFFLVISKRLLVRVDPLAATALLLGFGTIGMLGPGLTGLAGFDPGVVSARTWALGAFIVVFPTAGAYLLSFWALARVDASVVAFFIYLQPLIATTLSVLLLGERLALSTVAGAACVFAAVYLALRKPGPAGRASATSRRPG